MQLALLSSTLGKPISYFFPPQLMKVMPQDELTGIEQEMILALREIGFDELQKIAILQVRALSKFDPTEILLRHEEFAQEQLDIQTRIEEIMAQKGNKDKNSKSAS
jgi:hypothetical protein